jgi:membrane protein DedA with SNARE-associated domain
MSTEFMSLETIESLAHQYGYWTVFVGIMLENAGIPIPGETITLVGGFLAGSGELNYWGVMFAAISGAILGDNAGYWVGRSGGWPLLVRVGKLFRVSEAQLQSAKTRFSKNAAQAVFLGRFIALLRIFAGPFAGMTQMPYAQFLLCNAAGATVWATIMVSLASLAGRLISLEDLIHWVSQFAIVALGLVLAWVLLSFWLESRKTTRETSE